MSNQDKIQQLISHFSDSQLAITEQDGSVIIVSASEKIFDVCAFLKATLQYDYLQFLTCVDRSDKLELQYYLYSYGHQETAILKTNVGRLSGRIKSVSSIWKTADWHEREAYDLFGVVFEGHPDLRRILLEKDFEGHPLLKDYSSRKMVKLPKA